MLAIGEGIVAEPLRARESASSEEIALVRGARRGDREAFDALFERYFAPICAFASRRCASEAEVEALAERIWRRAIDALDEFPGDLRLGAWLHALARHELRVGAPARPAASQAGQRARGEPFPAD